MDAENKDQQIERLGLEQLGQALGFVHRIFKSLVVLVIIALCLSGIHSVPPGKVGYVMRFGKLIDEAEAPGLHWAFPFFIDRVLLFDTHRIRQIDIDDFAPSSLQDAGTPSREHVTTRGGIVHMKWNFTYILKDPALAYATIGTDDAEKENRIFRLLARDACVQAVAKTSIDTILYQPDRLRSAIKENLQKQFHELQCGFECLRVNMVDIKVPKDVAESFNKVQREALKVQNLKNQADSNAKVLEESVHAESQEILGRAHYEAVELHAQLKAEAAMVEGVLNNYQGSTRAAFLNLRRQSLIQEALKDTKGQTFLIQKDSELRMKLGRDPIVKRKLNQTQRDKHE